MDERERFDALVNRYVRGDGFVADGEEHRMAGAVRYKTGAPFACAAEVALGDQPVRLIALGNDGFLTVDDRLVVAFGDTAPGHTPGGELTGCLGRGVDEHAHDLLIGAPVAAAHRIRKVHVLVVTACLSDVGEARLHAALRGGRVRALGRNQRENDGVVTATLGGETSP